MIVKSTVSRFLLHIRQSVQQLIGEEKKHLISRSFDHRLCRADEEDADWNDTRAAVSHNSLRDCVELWCCAELERLLCLYEFSFGLLRSLSKCLDGNLYIRTNGSTYYTSQPNLTHSITGTYMRKTSAEKEVSDISGRKIITLKGPQCIVDKYPKKSWQGNIWSPNPSLTQGSMVLFFWVSLVSDLITNRAPSKN